MYLPIKMNSHLQSYIRALRNDIKRLLANKLSLDDNDFIYLAVAGERLRRQLHVDRWKTDNIANAYETALKAAPISLLPQLREELAQIMQELSSYITQTNITEEASEKYLSGIDELACIILAIVRGITANKKSDHLLDAVTPLR